MRILLLLPVFMSLLYVSNVMAATYTCTRGKLDYSWVDNKTGNNFLYVTSQDKNDGIGFYCGHKGQSGCKSGAKVLVYGSHFMDGSRNGNKSVLYECVNGNYWKDVGIKELEHNMTSDGLKRFALDPDGLPVLFSTNATRYQAGSNLYSVEPGVVYKARSGCEGGLKEGQLQQNVNCATLAGPGFVNAVACVRRCNSDGTMTAYVTGCKYGNPVGVPKTFDKQTVYDACPEQEQQDIQIEINNDNSSSSTSRGGSAAGGSSNVVNGGGSNSGNGNADSGDSSSANQEVGTYTCDDVILRQIDIWRANCIGNSNIVRQIDLLKEYCNGGSVTEEVVMNFYNTLQAYKPENCLEDAEAAERARLDQEKRDLEAKIARVKKLGEKMNKTIDGIDRSVWKTKDGKFNTARLASDSIAGVVLGTAGGLITSHVVKKNQEKSGFEDIQCTIGGQTTADYADQFSVGIK